MVDSANTEGTLDKDGYLEHQNADSNNCGAEKDTEVATPILLLIAIANARYRDLATARAALTRQVV